MTMQELQEQIINEFKIFDNWMDKYNYLIKLGKDLPSIDSKYKTKDNLIKDCQVKIWFHFIFRDEKIFYKIESNSTIINGIIFLLIKVLSGQKPKDIKNAELCFIDKIGLKENFSSIRRNNLWKLATQMKSAATACETQKNKSKI